MPSALTNPHKNNKLAYFITAIVAGLIALFNNFILMLRKPNIESTAKKRRRRLEAKRARDSAEINVNINNGEIVQSLDEDTIQTSFAILEIDACPNEIRLASDNTRSVDSDRHVPEDVELLGIKGQQTLISISAPDNTDNESNNKSIDKPRPPQKAGNSTKAHHPKRNEKSSKLKSNAGVEISLRFDQSKGNQPSYPKKTTIPANAKIHAIPKLRKNDSFSMFAPEQSTSEMPIEQMPRPVSPKVSAPISINTEADETSFTDSLSTLTASSPEISIIAREPSPVRIRRSMSHQPVRRLIETPRLPPCYINSDEYRTSIDLLSENFSQSECEASIFGSTPIKEIEFPNDFDILVVNIKTDEDRAKFYRLLQRFIDQGGYFPDKCGPAGYKTENRHVIKMHWRMKKIDFVLYENDILEHSKHMDFTLTLYFNLRQKKMYYVAPSTTLMDLHQKRIRTTQNPIVSFSQDPSRIFRAIRLIVAEGYQFRKNAIAAIKILFANDNNLFDTMNPDKLFQQLQLLFDSRHESQSLFIFYQLGIFFKLFYCVYGLAEYRGNQYLSRLEPYYHQFLFMQTYQPIYFVPCFYRPVAPYPMEPDVQINPRRSGEMKSDEAQAYLAPCLRKQSIFRPGITKPSPGTNASQPEPSLSSQRGLLTLS